jgi:hypothetical protein
VTLTRRRVALAAALLAFLAASLVIARWLSADGTERAKIEDVLEAQSRGDAAAMAEELERCGAACRRALQRQAADLRGRGDVEIVRYDSATSHAVGSERGFTRVVWRRTGPDDRLPTVQCFQVERTGTVLTGPRVTLLGLSAPIGREAGC